MFFNRFTRLKGLGRYACLGAAVLEQLGRKYKFHNIQKGRVDYLLNVRDNPSITCVPEKAVPYLARDYIASTIQQQAVIFPDNEPELVLVDSFSELTDQLFRHKAEGWQFCCNYQDLTHDDGFTDAFENLGLMSIEEFKEAYMRMLQAINARWIGIPIIYLHFPDALEHREKFVRRARDIKRVVEECAAAVPNLFSFSVPSEIVKRPVVVEPRMENFPYHYNQETYEAFAEMICREPVLKKFF
jgi:hypothetical protein